jgi:quinol monooxygenase YgiN
VIIVSGYLVVDAMHRASYLHDCIDVIVAARRAPGCLDFHLAADPLDPQRINVYEEWESVDAVEAFRSAGDDTGHERLNASWVHDARVSQHVVASSEKL